MVIWILLNLKFLIFKVVKHYQTTSNFKFKGMQMLQRFKMVINSFQPWGIFETISIVIK